MSAEVLDVQPSGNGVVVATLDRPEKRNALNRELRQAFIDTLHELTIDDEVKVVVIRGAGGTFCAGFDLDELAVADASAEVFAHATAYHHAVHTFTKPLIAAIDGAAVAGGMDLALMCDLRIAGSDARFGQPQVRLGVPAAFELLKTVVSEPVARELCLTGRVVDAAEALDIGLVNRVVEASDAFDAALALASEIVGVAGAPAMKRAFLSGQTSLFTPDGVD